MKRVLYFSFAIIIAVVSSCKKPNDTNATVQPTNVTETQVLQDFANVLVNPNYQQIQANANILNTSVQTLIATPTDANLQAAQLAWRNTRTSWEQCEGFLFGPVEDFNYDPNMDDWPVSNVEMDSLLSSKNPLAVSNIDSLPTTLKGFHSMEYILFGNNGTQTASNITTRQKIYVGSMAQSLYNTTTALRNSWDPSLSGNFTNEVVNAGQGSTRFTTRKDVFLAIVGSMSDICNEVANEKMQTPLAAQDPKLDESPFSQNSTTDFKNNITGVLHAYLCQYDGKTGNSISQLVSAKNISLDNTIKTQINAAISSFDNITVSYEQAIFSQKVQIHNTQNAINALKNTLDNDLTNFIKINIKD